MRGDECTRPRAQYQALDAEAIEESVSAILSEVNLCAVAVADSAGSWIASMYYAAKNSRELFVLTPPASRHARAWHLNPTVAVAIYDSTQAFEGMKRGLQLLVDVKEVATTDALDALTAYGQRFPSMKEWLSGPDDFEHIESRFFQLTVLRAKVFDEPRFGAEMWIEASREELG